MMMTTTVAAAATKKIDDARIYTLEKAAFYFFV